MNKIIKEKGLYENYLKKQLNIIYTKFIISNIQSQYTPIKIMEEKDVLEQFAAIFTTMHPTSFNEIFQSTIEYLVDKTHANHALQVRYNLV